MSICRTSLGNSGYIDFTVYGLEEPLPWYPGLYEFAYFDGLWRALYIGQADSIADRHANHERRYEAIGLGVTHVLVACVLEQAERDRLERLLIRTYNPPMNDQWRPSLSPYSTL